LADCFPLDWHNPLNYRFRVRLRLQMSQQTATPISGAPTNDKSPAIGNTIFFLCLSQRPWCGGHKVFTFLSANGCEAFLFEFYCVDVNSVREK
jgi:hypothetical protein